MIDFAKFLKSDASPSVDWRTYPWSSAQPALHWLGLAPACNSEPKQPLGETEAKLLAETMFERFWQEGSLAWSSYMLETCLRAMALSVKGPPEEFVKTVWCYFRNKKLDSNIYAFSRALGQTVLSSYRGELGWDLEWMTTPMSDSQRCLMYWVLGVKPELWSDQLEESALNLLSNYELDF